MVRSLIKAQSNDDRTIFIRCYSKCKSGGYKDCEDDPCLSDDNLIESINRDSASLGWRAYNYSEFYGRKLKEGFTYRLGTFEPRIKVKSMSRLSNRLETLDREFNSLNHWAGAISPIRDQGWCGWVEELSAFNFNECNTTFTDHHGLFQLLLLLQIVSELNQRHSLIWLHNICYHAWDTNRDVLEVTWITLGDISTDWGMK